MVQVASEAGEALDLEACFSQLTLDVIGKALFNYDFDALNTSSPLIQVPLQCWPAVIAHLAAVFSDPSYASYHNAAVADVWSLQQV